MSRKTTPIREKKASSLIKTEGTIDLRETFFGSAVFRCTQVCHNVQLTPWVNGFERTSSDKIYVITGGKGWLILDDRYYALRSGMALLIPAGICQRGDGRNLRILWSHFHAHTAGQLRLLPLCSAPECVVGKTARAIGLQMQDMLTDWQMRSIGYTLSLQSRLQQMLLLLLRSSGRDRRKPEKLVPLPEEENRVSLNPVNQIDFSPAIELILRCYSKPLTLAELARTVHLSPAYFCDRFKQYAGVPPLRFLEQHRVHRAQELLTVTDNTVQYVAAAVGYPDPYHFSRIFKRVTGITPSAYRDHSSRA